MRGVLIMSLVSGLGVAACETTPPPAPETREEMAERAKLACPSLIQGQATYTLSECDCVASRVTRLSWDPTTSSYAGDPMLYEDAKMIADTMTSADSMGTAMSTIRASVSETTKTSVGSCITK